MQTKGLSRQRDYYPHEAYDIIVLAGIERLTYCLNRGDSFSARGLNDMMKLRRRLDAFGQALDRRMEIEGFTYSNQGNDQ